METTTRRRGGRTRGTPNKRTVELAERLEQLGCDSVAGLVHIAADETASLELRARCYESLLPFIYPKRKAVDITHVTSMTYEEALKLLAS